jgi:hypothetical protein
MTEPSENPAAPDQLELASRGVGQPYDRSGPGDHARWATKHENPYRRNQCMARGIQRRPEQSDRLPLSFSASSSNSMSTATSTLHPGIDHTTFDHHGGADNATAERPDMCAYRAINMMDRRCRVMRCMRHRGLSGDERRQSAPHQRPPGGRAAHLRLGQMRRTGNCAARSNSEGAKTLHRDPMALAAILSVASIKNPGA